MQTNIFSEVRGYKYVALVVMAALLLWIFNLPAFLTGAQAAALNNVSVTLESSNPGATGEHYVEFTVPTNTEGADGELTLTYDVAFDISGAGITDVNVDGTGAIASALNVTGNEITIDITTELGAGDVVTFTLTNIENPAFTETGDPLEADSYAIFVATDDGEDIVDSAETRVVIIDFVTMTATIETIFDFEIASVGASETVNGVVTTATSTPTSIPFGVIEPDQFYFIAQELIVRTNASNGFVVTVEQNQNMESSTGERIHLFQDAEEDGVGTPTTWASPSADIGDFHTYGHYGVTTNDSNLDADLDGGGIHAFGANQFVGNIEGPRPVFAHTDAADGEEQNTGLARVGFGIEISSLQAAGTDYTNNLTYIATPTF